MNAVLWALAIPSLAFGLTVGYLDDWFDGHSLTPTVTTAVLGTGVALVGGLITYGTWRAIQYRAGAARIPLGVVAAHPQAAPSVVEAEAIAAHVPAYGDIAAAPDPADPGRLLLGPLHRHAAAGFHIDAVYSALFVRPVRAAAQLVSFLDREVVETYVRGSGTGARWLGTAVRRAQTGNVQTYLSALLAGSVVLAIAAVVLSNVNAGS
jgi:NADH-quinone oxidoreductase subunit L